MSCFLHRVPPALGALAALLLCATFAPARAGSPEEDWQAVTALDAGPQQQFRSAQEARGGAATHVARQEKLLRAFLAAHPTDSRVLEARLRLSRALQIRADMERSAPLRAEAKRMLDQVDLKGLTEDQRAALDFAKVSFLMRAFRTPTPAQRDELLSAARRFQSDHPLDRRVAPLLAEVARAFDAQPRTKRALLLDAQAIGTDPELKSAIADDLKRLDFLGGTVPLQFTSIQGQAFDIAQVRGKIVVLVFFAEWSPPSMMALVSLQKELASLPKGQAQIVGISLDENREALEEVMKVQGITWPVAFDGKGWQGPLVRSLGINTLPTVWLFDRQGRLQSLGAVESTAGQVRQLLQSR
jgi:peroxiredoxin